MHPAVISYKPGVCPVCNMSLIKVDRSSEDQSNYDGNIVKLSNRQQILAGIQTDTVKWSNVISGLRILGIVAIDEKQVKNISSRVSGRIDKLFFRASGEYLRKGSPLYEIYSEQLLSDEKEFVLLNEKIIVNPNSNKYLIEMLAAARNKLLLWGLTDNQIIELQKSKVVSPLITFYSPVEGYITNVLIAEGSYVEEGTPLIKIADLNHVWVDAQLYANEKINSKEFQIYSSVNESEIFIGHLVFNNPVLESDRKIQLLRIKVENSKRKLFPGMMVYVNPIGESSKVLTVPKSAVLSEKMKTVWVKVDETTFEQKMVETGKVGGEFIEIYSGLEEGEAVVTSGAYLINSEFIIKRGAGQKHDH